MLKNIRITKNNKPKNRNNKYKNIGLNLEK